MTSTTSTGMIGLLTPAEEAVMKGIRRSRFSFHFNTGNMRRWLLVQLVSVPANTSSEELEAAPSPYAHAHAHRDHRPATLDKLVNEYWASQVARRVY